MRARHMTVLGLLVAVAGPAAAQQPPAQPRRPAQAQAPAPGQMVERRMAERRGPTPEAMLRMREELGLTEAQVTRLEALRQERLTIQRERMAEMMELRSQREAGRLTPEQLRERMQARAQQVPADARQAFGERVRGVLTDQQRLRLAERQVEQLRQQVQGRQMGGGAGGRGMWPGSQGMRPNGRGMMPGMRGAPGRGAGDGPGRGMVRGRMQEQMQGRGTNPPPPRMRRPGGQAEPPR